MNTHTHTKCYLEIFPPHYWSYMCVGGKAAERETDFYQEHNADKYCLD